MMTEAGTAGSPGPLANACPGARRLASPDALPAAGEVVYHSRGSLLVIGQDARAAEAARRAASALPVVAILDADVEPVERAGLSALRGRVVTLRGHLGRFSAKAAGPHGPLSLAPFSPNRDGHFDLVLDLGNPPLLPEEVTPLGYFWVGADEPALEAALALLPGLVGELRKPRYVAYRPEICAHRRQGISGCTRCLDACPAGALRSDGETIALDLHRCLGCASCTAVCPSGALSYRTPRAAELRERLRTAVRQFCKTMDRAPRIVFHEEPNDRVPSNDAAHGLLPFPVGALASVGAETILAAFAYGAGQVELLACRGTPPTALRVLRDQVALASRLLEGLGYGTARLRLLREGDESMEQTGATGSSPASVARASFAGIDDKRATALMALEALEAAGAGEPEAIVLPEGAPFGGIEVDRDSCTLCLACTNLCPTGALHLQAPGGALGFVEAACVQCGLCARGCPENAITLLPRLLRGAQARRATRRLAEPTPAACARCGRPFLSQALVAASLRRIGVGPDREAAALRLCPACRSEEVMRAQVPDGRPG